MGREREGHRMIMWIWAALIAFFIKGLCGFANTLVFTTALSFGSSNVSISPVELLLGYPTNIILAWRERRSIDLRICAPLSALVILGSLPGALFLKNADTRLIKLLFGVVIVLLAGQMFWRDRHPAKARMSRAALGVVGLLSGILCGLYGVGALLGAYVSRVAKDVSAFKANICIVFLAENTFRVAMYAACGILTRAVALRALSLYPFMLLGMGLGMRASAVLDERVARRLVIALLMVSGAALVVQCL